MSMWVCLLQTSDKGNLWQFKCNLTQKCISLFIFMEKILNMNIYWCLVAETESKSLNNKY